MAEAEVLYRGAKFRVERQRVRDRHGGSRPYDVVVHPGAAVILPILPDGRVVLIHNHRPPAGAELLELPAGTVDPPESPLECARREVVEETGYTAGRIEPLVKFYSSPGIFTEMMHAFLATELTPGQTSHGQTEFIRVAPMDYDQVIQAIRDGRIVDGKTIAALLYYDRFVRHPGQSRH